MEGSGNVAIRKSRKREGRRNRLGSSVRPGCDNATSQAEDFGRRRMNDDRVAERCPQEKEQSKQRLHVPVA